MYRRGNFRNISTDLDGPVYSSSSFSTGSFLNAGVHTRLKSDRSIARFFLGRFGKSSIEAGPDVNSDYGCGNASYTKRGLRAVKCIHALDSGAFRSRYKAAEAINLDPASSLSLVDLSPLLDSLTSSPQKQYLPMIFR